MGVGRGKGWGMPGRQAGGAECWWRSMAQHVSVGSACVMLLC